ncbi:MAG: cytochrome c oxidase subunit II, partial [Eudoraea sp.]|nr:cytochrome c oxidase subunit II [Eudoraea sp.]
MTVLFTLAILLLIAIAIWQMTKIFELSQINADDSQVASDKDNKYNGYLMFVFLIFIYGITIFSFAKYSKTLLPVAA